MSLPGIRQKPRVGAFVCLRPQGRAGDLFVIKKAMNLGLGFVCGGCDPRRMAQAQAGACLQLRPQGRAGGKVSYIVAVLAERYGVSERKVYGLLKRFGSDCTGFAV